MSAFFVSATMFVYFLVTSACTVWLHLLHFICASFIVFSLFQSFGLDWHLRCDVVLDGLFCVMRGAIFDVGVL